MTLKIAETTLQGVSKETHPQIFDGIEAISEEFPDGWLVHLTPGSRDSIEVKLTAQRRQMLEGEDETKQGIQKVLRRMRSSLK
jgi:predicted ATPase